MEEGIWEGKKDERPRLPKVGRELLGLESSSHAFFRFYSFSSVSLFFKTRFLYVALEPVLELAL